MPPVVVEVISWPSSGGEFHTQRRRAQKSHYSLEELARWLNPIVQGWIGYYGYYRRSALDPVFRHLNKALVRWARRKFKTLKRHKRRTVELFDRLSVRCPRLFAHWRFGSARAFA
ncbi:maturase [Halomonas sp. PGE1]|nr:maturase [Halomonas sp. PGE1]